MSGGRLIVNACSGGGEGSACPSFCLLAGGVPAVAAGQGFRRQTGQSCYVCLPVAYQQLLHVGGGLSHPDWAASLHSQLCLIRLCLPLLPAAAFRCSAGAQVAGELEQAAAEPPLPSGSTEPEQGAMVVLR